MTSLTTMPRTARTAGPSSCSHPSKPRLPGTPSRNGPTLCVCIAVLFSMLLFSILFGSLFISLFVSLFESKLHAVGATSPLPQMGPPIRGLRLTELRDTFDEVHHGHRHEAIDIVAPRGTPVHAVVSGTIQKLFLSKAGGNTIYEFDDAGVYCYYYAHLDRYAKELREGMRVKRGSVIGFVGSTGNADPRTPHLHFAIFRLGPERTWWKGTAINPYPALVEAVRRENTR